MDKIESVKAEYDEKMARLLKLTEGQLPEFKEYVYEIDILILKLFANIKD